MEYGKTRPGPGTHECFPHIPHSIFHLPPKQWQAFANMITLSDVLLLAATLFCISVAGIFINRKNVIILLMCIELMLLAVNMNFIAF